MDEDNMLKTRLAIDERQLRNMQKKTNAWLTSLPTDSIESAQNTFETLLLFMSSYQTSIEQHPLLQKANTLDIQRYAEVVKETGEVVGSTADQISSLKDELREAQKVRNNKLEYDKVAREIMKLETREVYHESIRQLREDIELLRQEKTKKEAAFESRKRNVGALVTNIKDLQRMVEEERSRGHEMQKRLMDMDREYESSDDEASIISDNEAEVLANGTSHRFQERHDDDEDDDDEEEGMVAEGEEIVVNGIY
ncbi:hypothetical protein BX666DRAFT_1967651 [Dichotomocladium elegans]|nr:hypothetical protein BX666DRAFT_1967651 [Dichotomocladium elegans]